MGKKKTRKLFEKFQKDMSLLEELLKDGMVISGVQDLNFSEKAAILRNIEAEDRTYLAWIRTWAALAALIAGLITVYFKF